MRIKGRTKLLLCTCNNYKSMRNFQRSMSNKPDRYFCDQQTIKSKKDHFIATSDLFLSFSGLPQSRSKHMNRLWMQEGKGGGGQGVRCQMHVLHVPLVSLKDCKIVEDTENKWVFPLYLISIPSLEEKIQKLYNMRMKVSEDYWKLIIK